MEREEILKEVKGIVAHVLSADLEELKESTVFDVNLGKPFGMDSLDAVEITMELEKEFLILISDDEMENAKNLKGIVRLVSNKVNIKK